MKRAILKSYKNDWFADTCCCEVYLLRFTLSDTQMDSRRQITYVTQITQKNIVNTFNGSLDFMKPYSADSTAEKRHGQHFEQSQRLMKVRNIVEHQTPMGLLQEELHHVPLMFKLSLKQTLVCLVH